MNSKCYISLTAFIFLLIAIMHICRLIYCTQVMIDNWLVPYWFSWIGLAGASVLFVWAIVLLKKK